MDNMCFHGRLVSVSLKAYKFEIEKKQIVYHFPSSCCYVKEGGWGLDTIIVPKWLAKKKGLIN